MGSELNLVNYEIYQRTGASELFTDGIWFFSTVNEFVKPLRYFSADLHIDRIAVSAKIYVVKSLNKEVILEKDINRKLHILTDKDGLKILKKHNKAWISYADIKQDFSLTCLKNEQTPRIFITWNERKI